MLIARPQKHADRADSAWLRRPSKFPQNNLLADSTKRSVESATNWRKCLPEKLPMKNFYSFNTLPPVCSFESMQMSPNPCGVRQTFVGLSTESAKSNFYGRPADPCMSRQIRGRGLSPNFKVRLGRERAKRF